MGYDINVILTKQKEKEPPRHNQLLIWPVDFKPVNIQSDKKLNYKFYKKGTKELVEGSITLTEEMLKIIKNQMDKDKNKRQAHPSNSAATIIRAIIQDRRDEDNYEYLLAGNQTFHTYFSELLEGNASSASTGLNNPPLGGLSEPLGARQRSPVKQEINAHVNRLEDQILNHKNTAVKSLIALTKKITPDASKIQIKINEDQTNANYPCLIIGIDYPAELNLDDKSKATINKILVQLLTTYINHELYKHQQPPYVEERSSFGFLTPTTADLAEHGIRLSLGLVPNGKWCSSVAAGIKNFNNFLSVISSTEKIDLLRKKFNHNLLHDGQIILLAGLFESGVMNTDIHKVILKSIELLPDLKSKNNEKKAQALIDKDSGSVAKTLDQAHSEMTSDESDEFKALYNKIIVVYMELYQNFGIDFNTMVGSIDKTNNNTYGKINFLCDMIDYFRYHAITNLHEWLGSERRKLLQSSQDALPVHHHIDNNNNPQKENANDTVREINYVPSGMASLACPLLAFRQANLNSNNEELTTFARLPGSYFELERFEKCFSKEHFKDISNIEDPFTADVIYVDANPCTVGSSPPNNNISEIIHKIVNQKPEKSRMLVVDISSSTQDGVKKIMEEYTNVKKDHPDFILCLSQSALKNRQLGADMAPYGVIKIIGSPSDFTKDVCNILDRGTRGSEGVLSKVFRRGLREAEEAVSKLEPAEIEKRAHEAIHGRAPSIAKSHDRFFKAHLPEQGEKQNPDAEQSNRLSNDNK